MRTLIASAAAALALTASLGQADVSVAFAAPWDGKKVPAGQQCALHGGNGATPPMQISGVPQGAAWIVVAFNDKSYQPLSRNGGHGTIAWPAKAGTVMLQPVPGMTARLPHGAQVIAAAKSTGQYASSGYLPPCSGGRGNKYTADISVVDGAGKVIASKKNVAIGRY